VRIEVVAPVRLSNSRLQRLETTEVTDVAGITRELRQLRKRLESDYYRKEAADMLRAELDRLPARRYPRACLASPREPSAVPTDKRMQLAGASGLRHVN
jgi:hypothetical protein